MATQSKLFKINTSQVLRCIWLNEGISRIQIAKVLQMDKSTVSKIVSNLLLIGIIETMDEESSRSQGGRKPVPLRINMKYGCILGIELQTDSYTAVITDLNGGIISDRNDKIDFEKKSLIEIFLKITEEMIPLAEKHGLLGIVLGISGIINSAEGVILKSNPLNIDENFSFRKEIRKHIDIPVFIENDANCCCWGELTVNRTNRLGNMLFMLGEFREVESQHTFYSGIGFGFGIVINGKVYHGQEHSAGEFKSIFSDAPSISQFSLSDDKVENIQDKPEELAVLFRELARNISLVINFFNLNHIIIGGEIEQYEDMIRLMLTQEIQRNWSYPGQLNFTISSSKQGKNAVAYGAACMFLENLFGVPDMNNEPEKGINRGIELLETVRDIEPEESEESTFTYNPI